jgi:hypothetical protein
MTVTVAHSTPADGTFSASGATAWNANHTLTGVGTMAEQDANNVNITGGSITGVTGVGTVTAVTGTAPIASSGGTTPAISIPKATTSVDGYLSATDWTTFNNKLATAVTSATAGTGMSVSASTGPVTFTNTAPDQVVGLTAGTGINVSGTYPNFTIANASPSLGGDVVGPASATDNAVARFNLTTGKLIQNSAVIIDDSNNVTGVNTLTATNLVVNDDTTLGGSNADTLDVRARISSDLEPNTDAAHDIGTSGRNWRDGFFSRNLQVEGKVVSPHFDALNSAGGQLRNASGTPQLEWGSGGGNNVSIDVAININPANAQVSLAPTGTGTVVINPATAGTINNMVIGGTTPLAITGTTITATTYVGVGGGVF